MPAANSNYPQAGFRYFVARGVVNLNTAFYMKFGSKTPGLRVAAKR